MELRELLKDTEYDEPEPVEELPSPGMDWGTVGKGALAVAPLALAALALRRKLPLRRYKKAFEKALVSKDAIKRGGEDIGLLKDAAGKIIERPWTQMLKVPAHRTPVMPKTEVTNLFRRNLLGTIDEGVSVSKETIREAGIALRKNGLSLEDLSSLRYHGLQEGEGMRMHLFTLIKPDHPLHGSTIAGNLLGKKVGPLKALQIKSPKSKKVIIVKSKPQHVTHSDIYADLPADLQNVNPKFIESGYIEKGKFTPKIKDILEEKKLGPIKLQKEPWEMTKNEFSTFKYEPLRIETPETSVVREILEKNNIPIEDIGLKGSRAFGVETKKSDFDIYVRVHESLRDKADTLIAPLLPKKNIDVLVNWEGVGKKGGILRGEKTHERIVEQAFSKGKPIPKKVLADYPRLGERKLPRKLPKPKKKWTPKRGKKKVILTKKGIEPMELHHRLPLSRNKWEGNDKAWLSALYINMRELDPTSPLLEFLNKSIHTTKHQRKAWLTPRVIKNLEVLADRIEMSRTVGEIQKGRVLR